MADIETKNIDSPDETREIPNGKVQVLTIGTTMLGRATFEPGWKWSESVKPIAGTDSCEVHHNGYVVSGRLHVAMNDGSEVDLVPGDFFVCPPGHDAWVVGNEPCVSLDFSTEAVSTYAKPK